MLFLIDVNDDSAEYQNWNTDNRENRIGHRQLPNRIQSKQHGPDVHGTYAQKNDQGWLYGPFSAFLFHSCPNIGLRPAAVASESSLVGA